MEINHEAYYIAKNNDSSHLTIEYTFVANWVFIFLKRNKRNRLDCINVFSNSLGIQCANSFFLLIAITSSLKTHIAAWNIETVYLSLCQYWEKSLDNSQICLLCKLRLSGILLATKMCRNWRLRNILNY